MQSFCGSIRLAKRALNFFGTSIDHSKNYSSPLLSKFTSRSPLALSNLGNQRALFTPSDNGVTSLIAPLSRVPMSNSIHQPAALLTLLSRYISTMADQIVAEDTTASDPNVAPRIKFKRPDKTARHIMQIVDKESVEAVKGQREIPEIKPGYIIQLKVEVPENKRRVSILKGIVIARRNAGLNTTFRLRRLVAGVGVESLFLLYSPNIKEIKVLDKKKVRRAKLYYLRDKMNALRK